MKEGRKSQRAECDFYSARAIPPIEFQLTSLKTEMRNLVYVHSVPVLAMTYFYCGILNAPDISIYYELGKGRGTNRFSVPFE